MRPILIIDHNYYCHRAMHINSELSNRGENIGVIFGYLLALKKLSQDFETDKFVFACDSKESIRKKMFPGYKAGRTAEEKKKSPLTPEEEETRRSGYAQFTKLRETILPALGFRNIYLQKGYEADDLTARFVQRHCDKHLIMCTPDEDHFQLLGYADMYSSASETYWTAKKFSDQWGILPSEWAEIKSIAGCHSDHVPGIPGVGAKTAVKFILNQMNSKTSTYKKIVQGSKEIAFYRKLVTLPMPGTNLYKLKEDELNFDEFLKVCSQYGFTSFVKGVQRKWWSSFFNKGLF